MKKQFSGLLVLAISAVACTHQPNDQPAPEPILVGITASIDMPTEMQIKWEANSDRIGLFTFVCDSMVLSNVYLAAVNSSITSQFASHSTDNNPVYWNANTNNTTSFYSYFPYRTTATNPKAVSVSLGARQTIIPNELPAIKKNILMTASRIGAKQSDGDVSLIFKPIYGILKCDVSVDNPLEGVDSLVVIAPEGYVVAFGSGTYDLMESELTVIGDPKNELIGIIEGKTTLSSTPQSFYFTIAPGLAGKTLSFVAYADGERFDLGSIELPSSGVTGGLITPISLTGTVPNVEYVDLSIYGTANTYVINKPSTNYKFRANIKGNGVARDYKWSVDGMASSKSYKASDLDIAPDNAILLWYNTPKSASGWVNESPIVVGSVNYDSTNGYITFTSPDSFVSGNAVVAACDAEGTIVWSWNIWAVEDWDYQTSSRRVGRYDVMDRNLGAIKGNDAMQSSSSREAAAAIGNYYQWGRKDPFPAANGYDNSTDNIGTTAKPMEWGLPTHTPIDALKNDCTSESWGDFDLIFTLQRESNVRALGTIIGATYSIDEAVLESIKYPYKWLSSGIDENSVAPYMWFSADNISRSYTEQNSWHYLWGSTDSNSNEKSIYDPCPVGYKVPTVDLFNYLLNNTTLTSNGYGVYSKEYDIYIPFAGQRRAAFGGSTIAEVNTSIYLASASATGPYYPLKGNKVLSDGVIVGDGVSSYNCYVSAGMQIRCVKEVVSSTMISQSTQSGPVAVLMGNSITEQWPIRGRKTFFSDNNYVGKGISGQTSQNMLNRFYTDVLKLDPQCVVITAGTNDIADNDGYHRSLEDILSNIRLMAERVEENGAEVIIGAVAPSRDMWWQSDAWKAENNGDKVSNRIVEMNKLLKAYAVEKGFGYADYHTALKDDQNNLKDDYCWQFSSTNLDHVHPNYDGYIVMEGVLKPIIVKMLTIPNAGAFDNGSIDDLDKWEWK